MTVQDPKTTKGSLRSATLMQRFAVALVLMSVLPLLYAGYLFTQYVKVSPHEGMWIFLAMVFLVVIVGAGAFLVRSVFASVIRFTQNARAAAMGAPEDAIVPIRAQEGGELGELGNSLSAIMSRIRNETAALQVSQKELEKTETRLLDSYAKLREANAKLKEMDQMKSDFVANVAHELINPLATIRGSLDLVLANLGDAEDPEKKQIVEISRRNMARLIRLVKDMLDVAAIESGKVDLRVQNIDVNEMVNEILVPLQKLITDKRLHFEKKVSVSPPVFEADRDRIIQALTNLLINAIRYTPEGGSVSLGISNRDGMLQCVVSDTGEGISAEDQTKLFDKFSRVSKEKREGTGLGLCITKDIVTLHHGEISVRSEEGKGSTFMFVIPMHYEKAASPTPSE